MTTTMAVESNSTRQIRLVGSEEQSNPALADARIHASADKSKAADTTSSTSSRSVNRSSMSSAVADLASGMCIFGSNSSSGAGSGGDYCQGNNNNNNSGSAPIISGTAAAVLALHSASCSNNSNYDNIVSSNSSRGSAERKMMIATAASAVTAGREGGCGREGFTPNPSETSVILAGGAQAIADIAPASTASKKMHDHNISNDISVVAVEMPNAIFRRCANHRRNRRRCADAGHCYRRSNNVRNDKKNRQRGRNDERLRCRNN
jgi:hypothetical protein